jgi:hypothetical protein
VRDVADKDRAPRWMSLRVGTADTVLVQEEFKKVLAQGSDAFTRGFTVCTFKLLAGHACWVGKNLGCGTY